MITEEKCQEIADFCRQNGVSDEVISQLRQAYSGIHFTYCMDDDLPNNHPVLEAETFNLYLVDGREHCLCMTNDHAIATGIVIAEIIPE